MENLIEIIRRNTVKNCIEDIKEDINRSLVRLNNHEENIFRELISMPENYESDIRSLLSKRTFETWQTFISDKNLESFTIFVNSFSTDYGILLAIENREN